MKERWKPVVGYEGVYEVSDRGRVRSLDRALTDGRWHRGRLLKQSTYGRNGPPYYRVGLSHDTRLYSVTAHTLMLTAFRGPRPKGMEARHLDGNPKNNHLANLRWGTGLENSQDQRRHGTAARGSRQGSAKLSEKNVLEIRKRYAAGELQKTLATEFKVLQQNISRIVNRLRWRHLK